MALTVSGYTQRSNCDGTTGWSAGATESDLYAEGAGCLKLKVSNTTSAVVTYDLGSGGTNLSGLHMGLYLFVAGTWDTKLNGGVSLYAEDTSGNWYRWDVGGSDTNYPGRAGFQLYTIDLDNTNPDANSGTLSTSAIRYLGFRVKTLSKAIKENVFWDNLYTFDALTITSTATEAFGLQEIADWAETNENSLVVKLTDKVYLTRTGIKLGSTTAGLHVDFKTDSERIVFEDRTVGDGGTAISATLYQWKVQGNSTGTINYETGSKSGTAGILGMDIQDNTGTCEVDFNDSNIDVLKIYGGTIDGVTTIKFPNLTGANYECLSTVFIDHGEISPSGFKVDGNWLSVNAKSNAFQLDSTTHLLATGKIIDPVTSCIEVTVAGPYSFNDIVAVGTSGTGPYDINNTHTAGVTVNITGDTNFQYSTGSSVTFQGSAVVTITVKDEETKAVIQNAQTSMWYESVVGEGYDTQIMNEDTNASGVATETYTGSTPKEAKLVISKSDDLDDPRYKRFTDIVTITSDGYTRTVFLERNPVLN